MADFGSQSEYVPAGQLNASHIGKGIWGPIRYLPNGETNWEGSPFDYGWARITMVTHTSKGTTKVRIRNSGLVDATYQPNASLQITREEFTR